MPRIHIPILLVVVALTFAATAVEAEVSEASDQGFVSQLTLTLNGTGADAYRALTTDIARWWDGQHTYSGEAGNLSMTAVAGGCFCEKLADGGSVEHGRVVYASPGVALRLNAAFGPLQEIAVTGSVSFILSSTPEGRTQLAYRYVVGGYVPGGLSTYAAPVDQVMTGQMLRLQRYLDTGSPQ